MLEKPHRAHNHDVMITEFKRRFIVSTILTLPVILLSPSIQKFLGYELSFPGRIYILWLISSIIYVYGGYPFLKGVINEIKKRLPDMMTLIGVAISIAYFYSTAVTFLIQGETFFWELATLIDVMLIGHWMRMRTITGASRAPSQVYANNSTPS